MLQQCEEGEDEIIVRSCVLLERLEWLFSRFQDGARCSLAGRMRLEGDMRWLFMLDGVPSCCPPCTCGHGVKAHSDLILGTVYCSKA